MGDTVQINITTKIFEQVNYLWSTELFKVLEILDTKLIKYRLRDANDEEILGHFMTMNFKKLKIIVEYMKIEKR